MRKENLPKLKVVWEQTFPEDAEMRVQRAFEMLLNDESFQTHENQLKTAIDKDSSMADNETSEKKINKVTHLRRSGRTIEGVSAVCFAVLKIEKAERKQVRGKQNISLENSGRGS